MIKKSTVDIGTYVDRRPNFRNIMGQPIEATDINSLSPVGE